MNENCCVISFANAAGNYYRGLARLNMSLSEFWQGRFIGFTDEFSIGAPLHTDNPYAFKLYAFKRALAQGYRKILYVDASVWAVRNIQPVFDTLDRESFVMQESGHYIRRWCNQHTLDYFKHKREDFGDAVMYGNAGMLGLDFDKIECQTFFHRWFESMQNDCFKGSWDDHRHDMVCGSIIAWEMGLMSRYINGEQILEYAHWDDPIKNESIVFKAAGL